MATHQPEGKTIVLSGGGTGGHITPILAVAHELKKQDPTIRTVYIGERGGKFQELTDTHEAIDQTYAIFAGKFRRYHGQSKLRQIFAVRTNLLNIRDLFYFAIGTVQAWFLLAKIKPSTVFLKGGFVGVPVGLSAATRHIPFMTHDSDALPGLANRIVSRWAKLHAVAMPVETYVYPKDKTVQVGVLVESAFQRVTPEIQKDFKQQISVPADKQMLLITGASSGANKVNIAMTKIADKLLQDFPELYIVHQAGKGKAGVYGSYTHERLTVLEFMRPMYVYTGAADVVVARASGNTIAELGTQGKAVIAVPNPELAGGHQTKNADALVRANAAIIVKEDASSTDEQALDAAIRSLLTDKEQAQKLADSLHAITLSGAAAKLASHLLKL